MVNDSLKVRALVLRREDGESRADVEHFGRDLFERDGVQVSVLYSSLNYKDALAVTGRGKIIRGEYPFVAGIDFVGEVMSSAHHGFSSGDFVIGTGWGLGETHWGGYAEVVTARGDWLVPLPPSLSPENAMVAGTAGLTAMLSVLKLEECGVAASGREIVVTGASGGVGSMAIVFLSRSGFEVTASTGGRDAHDYLHQLGARQIIDRDELASGPFRSLDSGRWAGAVDTVGGRTLATILSQTKRHGSVAACGLAGGHELETTVFPFILRGVNLLGIDSNTCPMTDRVEAWDRISKLLTPDVAGAIRMDTISLGRVPEYSERLLSGGVRGRVVVDVRM